MLIAIYGMFATGKTYVMENCRDRLADVCPRGRGLHIVTADINTIYTLDGDVWLQDRDRAHYATWKGKQTDKCDQLQAMIVDKDNLWVVESARYFGGMYGYIRDAISVHNGGIAFIVPTVKPKIGRRFLMERAKKANKTYRDDYWDNKRLEYECRGRYMNAMNTHYIPLGIYVYELDMDYERRAWDKGLKLMEDLVAWDVSKWYNLRLGSKPDGKSGSNKRIERERQDHHSQAVDSHIGKRVPLTRRKR